MKIQTILLFVAMSAATAVSAQTKISGTQQCKSAEPTPVDVGDRPNHAFAVVTAQCTWPKPIEIAGLQVKDGMDTLVTEISGNTANERGYDVCAMSNGDKFTVRFNTLP